MWAGLTFASAFYMIGFGQYLLPGLGQYIGFLADWGQIGITVAALVMAALLTAVNYYGVKETGSLQNVIVLTLVGLITAFLTLGIISGPTTGEFNPNGWPAVAATIGTVYVTFIGFEVIATSAEEIKNPSRNLPLAMIASVVTPTLMYVGVMFVSTGALSIEALTVSQIPVADVATEFMGPIGALAMIIGAVLATVSSANASILSAARVNFAMGRDRILVNWLNEVHERFRTPYRAITATGVVTLVLIAIGVGIGTLAEVASFMYLVTYALVHVTVIVLRRANPDAYDPAFQIPSILYPIVPAIGTLACLAVLVQMSIEFVPATVGVGPVELVLPVTPTAVSAIGTVLIVFGIGWYYFYARNRALSESLVGEAIAPEPAAMADGEGRYRVVVPVANPETEQDLLQMAAASAHAHEDEHAEVIAVNIIEVPRQTSLSQDLTFEEDRVEQQQKLLDSARDIVADLDIGLQTRAIVGRNAGSVILDVIEEENADHVFLGWQGTRSRREYILGSTIDPVIGRAPCDATLVKLGPEDSYREGNVMVLAGKGPHAPVAARRAAEFVSAADDDASLTLLNVQTLETDTDADLSPTERGETVVEELAERAGIEYMSYNAEVKVAEDTEQAIIEAAKGYDTVCVGATRSGPISQAVFGSLPEKVGAEVNQTVVMARGPEESPMSVRQALLQRLVGQA
jgi:amino acid transporter/nucleotide-binding universal stress UspA family protein